jgi:hypothetical protein
MANKFQALTGYADDTILSMQNVLLGFKNIKGDNFEAASLQIINMAKVMRMDLSSAAQAVGKALDDPIAGIDSLTRQGFRWTQQEKELLRESEMLSRKMQEQETGGIVRMIAEYILEEDIAEEAEILTN